VLDKVNVRHAFIIFICFSLCGCNVFEHCRPDLVGYFEAREEDNLLIFVECRWAL
jgi:hypothetical protein